MWGGAAVHGAHVHPACVVLGCRATTLLGAGGGKGCWRAWPGGEGVGRAPWKELGGEWDPMVDGAGAVKDDAPLVIQFTKYLSREAGAPSLPGQHPARQADVGSRKEPWP